MLGDEADQPVRGGEIGADRVVGATPVTAQMVGPGAGDRTGRMIFQNL